MATTTTSNGQFSPSTFPGAFNGTPSGTGQNAGAPTSGPATGVFQSGPIQGMTFQNPWNPVFNAFNAFNPWATGFPAFGTPVPNTGTPGFFGRFNPVAFNQPWLNQPVLGQGFNAANPVGFSPYANFNTFSPMGQFNPFSGGFVPFGGPVFNTPWTAVNPWSAVNPWMNPWNNGGPNTAFNGGVNPLFNSFGANASTPIASNPGWNNLATQTWGATPWSSTQANPGFGFVGFGAPNWYAVSNPWTANTWSNALAGMTPFMSPAFQCVPGAFPASTNSFGATPWQATAGNPTWNVGLSNSAGCPMSQDCACPPGTCYGQIGPFSPGFSGGFNSFNPFVPSFGAGSNHGYTQPYGSAPFTSGPSTPNSNPLNQAWGSPFLGSNFNPFVNAWTPTGGYANTVSTFQPYSTAFPGGFSTPGMSGVFGSAFGSPVYATTFPYATNPNNPFVPGLNAVSVTNPFVYARAFSQGSAGVTQTVGQVGPVLAGCCRAAA